jgi:AcrR family transcriptional regulator
MPRSERSNQANDSPRQRRARGSLSGEEILAAAYELAEHDGLEALSMPALGRQVGAGVTSIYWYFRNKDDLLVALAEQVTADVYLRWTGFGDGPWDEELRRSFVAFRDELTRVPVYLELFSLRPRFVLSRPSIFPMVMRRLESDLSKLVGLGLTPTEAAHAYSSCSIYVRGFVKLEQGQRGTPEELDEALHSGLVDTFEHLDAAAFPVLTLLGDIEPMTELSDDAFIRGLDLVIGGIREVVEGRVESSLRHPR